MMSNEDGSDHKDQEAHKGCVWYTLDSQDSNNTTRKQMPVLSSSVPKKRLTAEEIEEKIAKAEKRRVERNKQRSQNAVENREKMSALTTKINKLAMHQEASKTTNEHDNKFLMDKKEYCKTAAEVSFEFENLAKRYKKVLAVTKLPK